MVLFPLNEGLEAVIHNVIKLDYRRNHFLTIQYAFRSRC